MKATGWCWLISLAVLALAALATLAPTATAEEGQVQITSNYPVTVLHEGAPARVPFRASEGTTVCAPPVQYVDVDARLRFVGWNWTIRDPCVTLRNVKALVAVYKAEYLVVIDSELENLRRSFWVEEGTVVELVAPSVHYESDGVRLRFVRWSLGEYPFNSSNRVYVSRPLRIEAVYVREYYVQGVSPYAVVNGSGWYRLGQTVLLSAPSVIQLSEGERLVLTGWESVGSVPAIVNRVVSNVAVLEVRGPHVVRPVYERQYRVVLTGPKGVVYDGWVTAGEKVAVSVESQVVLRENEVRLRFVGWNSSLLPPQERLELEVKGPVRAEAVYVRQYYVEVRGRYGAGGTGWYDEGSEATLMAVPNPPGNAFFRPRLTGFVGNIGTLEHRNGAIRVVVDRPIRVEAVYVTEPDLVNIGLLAAVIAGSGFLLLYRPSRKGRSKPRTGSMEKQEEDQVLRIRLCSKGHEVPADANVCPECGEILSPAVSQSP
ncbi:MAG: hypothetical protein NYU90_03140 [Aigarchaeota archaeon]|nr:hypothetical protein [Candidatus Calditenuis fumarioli]